MRARLFEFGSRQEKYFFFGIVGILLILIGATFYPIVKANIPGKTAESQMTAKTDLLSSKSPEEYYQMFQCSCCGRPIDADCCGMSKQRKEYLDELLLGGLEEDEIAYRMVKKFGFAVLMEASMEQEIKEYIKSKAPENPPAIGIENPRYNFGTISQKDGIVSTVFTVRNSGGSDLVIENIDTSCMCTTASLTYRGKESPEFGMSMHGNNPKNFELRIPPGDSAQLNVHYDPMAHGEQKKPELRITREVTIVSNDPADFQKNVRIEITQVP